MRPPVLTMYQGELRSMSWLERNLRIDDRTLSRMHRRGMLSERRINAHLKRRDKRDAMRALARAHGVSLPAMRQREQRGWDEYRAASEPMHRTFTKRVKCHRRGMGAAVIGERYVWSGSQSRSPTETKL